MAEGSACSSKNVKLTKDGVACVVCPCACPMDANLLDSFTVVSCVDCYVPFLPDLSSCKSKCTPPEVVIKDLSHFPKTIVEQMACKSMRNAITHFSQCTQQPTAPEWFKAMGRIATNIFTVLARRAIWYTDNTHFVDAIGNPLGEVLNTLTTLNNANTGEPPTHGTTVRVMCLDGRCCSQTHGCLPCA